MHNIRAFFDFGGFTSVTYTTLNKLLAVFSYIDYNMIINVCVIGTVFTMQTACSRSRE